MKYIVTADKKVLEVCDNVYSSIGYEQVKEYIFDLMTPEEKEEFESLCDECYVRVVDKIKSPLVGDLFINEEVIKNKAKQKTEDFVLYKYIKTSNLSNFFHVSCDYFNVITNYNMLRNLLLKKRTIEKTVDIKIDISFLTGLENDETSLLEFSKYINVTFDQVFSLYNEGLSGKEIYNKISAEKKYREDIEKIMSVVNLSELGSMMSIESLLTGYSNLLRTKKNLINKIIIDNDIKIESEKDFDILFVNDYNDCLSIENYSMEDYDLIFKGENKIKNNEDFTDEEINELLYIAQSKRPGISFNTKLIARLLGSDIKINSCENESEKVKKINISSKRK